MRSGQAASEPLGGAGPSARAAVPGGAELSARDRAVLDIAGRTFTGPGPRERAVRERLGISPTAYFQLLNALLDDPRALAHAPGTVNRLRRERDRLRDER
ncbi:DUF3263 domain-containing protein [Actinacidiphila sp. ITFR-21]|uniref:DUF3263 domain-containing protein n=1 Tax=Actinacidiphila sp. ITFR-21 TaxID=3075199 RepID=UPI00288BC077|nr:DUF3263 domain-containing protein [Streptomyces sp. ITFR-21]WNI16045.1 DUF3263 domain-containing protein [Streptomyces sp. ITFR-21]